MYFVNIGEKVETHSLTVAIFIRLKNIWRVIVKVSIQNFIRKYIIFLSTHKNNIRISQKFQLNCSNCKIVTLIILFIGYA